IEFRTFGKSIVLESAGLFDDFAQTDVWPSKNDWTHAIHRPCYDHRCGLVPISPEALDRYDVAILKLRVGRGHGCVEGIRRADGRLGLPDARVGHKYSIC